MRALWILVLVSAVSAAEYRASQENFPNPERGFYVQAVYDPGLAKPSHADPAWLRDARQHGMSLLRQYWILREFRDAPISPEALRWIETDFRIAREAGIKIIGRFAYNFSLDEPDAPIERVMQHLDQLAPILRDNADVIAFQEAGFVGAWGEWHHSTNNLQDHGREIVDRLLSILPKDRMIALRYPRDKMMLTGDRPLTPKDAWNGSEKARIGAHDDCFLASATDRGTWTGNIAAEKAFYHQDNLFVPQGGETCDPQADAQSLILCDNALRQLDFQHFTTLNSAYQKDVLAGWEDGGCMPEIQRRLGYRFRLVESHVTVKRHRVRVTATIRNDGFADLYNPRPLLLVLRNRATGALQTIPSPVDPRRWMPGQETQIRIDATAAKGEYDVLLYLPDASERLRARPEYAVRFANEDVWEPQTGMNRLSEVAKVQ